MGWYFMSCFSCFFWNYWHAIVNNLVICVALNTRATQSFEMEVSICVFRDSLATISWQHSHAQGQYMACSLPLSNSSFIYLDSLWGHWLQENFGPQLIFRCEAPHSKGQMLYLLNVTIVKSTSLPVDNECEVDV